MAFRPCGHARHGNAERADAVAFGLPDKSCRMIAEALSRCPEITDAVIFGSRAMGNQKHGSDVDLAIKGPGVSARTVARLSTLLNEELPLPYRFEVVDYNRLADPAVRRHIDEHGRAFYRSLDAGVQVAESPAAYGKVRKQRA